MIDSTGMENYSYYNHDTENDVLCACFDPKWVDDVICNLKSDYFHAAENRVLFQAIKEMYDKSIPIDTRTVYDYLNRDGKAEAIGGILKILGVFNATPSLANVMSYIDSLKEYYYRRRIYEAGRRLKSISETSGDPDEAERIVMSIREGEDDLAFSDMTEASGNVYTSFLKRKNNEDDPNKLMTFYNFFDEVMGGFFAGQMIVLAARPGVGKSTIALNICKNIIEKSAGGPEKKQVLFLSLEMTKEEICKKIALCKTGKSEDYYIGHPDKEKEYTEALEFVSENDNLHIVCQGHINTTRIKALARRVKHKYGAVNLIVIDYLQLMDGSSVKKTTREREIADITRELKVMAKEFSVPIIALSQLNRAFDSRVIKIPKLSDLRESGAIEQDADKVFLVYNYLDAHGGKGMEEELRNVIVIDCPKNRQGIVTSQYFFFNRPASKVRELTREEDNAIAELEEKEDDYYD